MANHFTVKVNELGQELSTLEKVNQFVESAGYEINSNGGKIKGTPEVYLISLQLWRIDKMLSSAMALRSFRLVL